MKADDPRAQEWRKLLIRLLDEANMSQSELGRRIGRTSTQINQWVSEGNRYAPPDPDLVFAIEDVLGCPDLLSTVLGYVRPSDVPDVVRAIRADRSLTRGQRGTLLDLYQVMVGGRSD